MSKNPEKPPNLHNLPLKIAKLIVEPLDHASRNSLRLTTKSLQNAVDDSKVTYEKLTLKLAEQADAFYVELITDKNDKKTREFKPENPGCLGFLADGVCHVMKILKNPKVHLNQLIIDLESPTSSFKKSELIAPLEVSLRFKDAVNRILNHLSSELLNLPFKLSVNHFKMEFDGRQDHVLKILPNLEPVTLKKISLISSFMVIATDKIVELEQWKKAEELEWPLNTYMALEHWKHFRKVDINWEKPSNQEIEVAFETFLFTTNWKHVSIAFPDAELFSDNYLKTSGLPYIRCFTDKTDKRKRWIRVPRKGFVVQVSVENGKLMMYRAESEFENLKKWQQRRMNKSSNTEKAIETINNSIINKPASSLKLIDNYTGTTYEKLTITLLSSRPAITINVIIDKNTKFSQEIEKEPGGYKITNPEEGFEMTVAHPRHAAFVIGAIEQVLKICKEHILIKNLVLKVEPDSFVEADSFCTALADQLDQNRLKVEHLTALANPFECHKLLAHLQPGILKKIQFLTGLPEAEASIQKTLLNLESWRRAQELKCSDLLPVELWKHFPSVQLYLWDIEAKELLEVFETLLASSSWENVKIKFGPRARGTIVVFFRQLEDLTPLRDKRLAMKLVKAQNDNQYLNNHHFVQVELTDDTFTLTRVVRYLISL